MLRIRQIESYRLPRYPHGLYYEHSGTAHWKATGTIASVATLALLVSSSCTCVGTVGPPPVDPDMVTEKEARDIINQVFVRNGIKLETDVPYSFTLSNQSPIQLELDGFNKDLNMGYEYISREDRNTFTKEVREELDKARQSNVKGPCIKTIDEQFVFGDAEKAHKGIEAIIKDFIADLHSKGIIQ